MSSSLMANAKKLQWHSSRAIGDKKYRSLISWKNANYKITKKRINSLFSKTEKLSCACTSWWTKAEWDDEIMNEIIRDYFANVLLSSVLDFQRLFANMSIIVHIYTTSLTDFNVLAYYIIMISRFEWRIKKIEVNLRDMTFRSFTWPEIYLEKINSMNKLCTC